MPTQFDAWKQAWRRVDEEVRDGALSNRGVPATAARQMVFSHIFTELPTNLRSVKMRGASISQTESDLIEQAVSDRAEQLRTVSRLAGLVKEWLSPQRTPEVQPQLARVKNRADEYLKWTVALIRSHGIDGVSAVSDSDVEAWLRSRYALDETIPPEAAATPSNVRFYLRGPRVSEQVAEDLALAYAATPRNQTDSGCAFQPMGLDLTGPSKATSPTAVEAAALTVLNGMPHDTLCGTAGLTAVLDRPLTAPAVLDDDPSQPSARRRRPLDRPLETRLVDYNDETAGSGARGITVRELVAEEVERAASPLGLASEGNRLALIAAVATMAFVTWPEGRRPLILAEDEIAQAPYRASMRLRSLFPGRTFEMLPAATRSSINDPTSTYTPRAWSRLHNWERDGKDQNPYDGVVWAFNSWCDDLGERGWEPMIHPAPLEEWLDTAPNKLTGVILDETPEFDEGDRAFVSLENAHKTLGTPVITFVKRVHSDEADPAEWQRLVARVEARNPLPHHPTWATFEEIVAFLDSIRTPRP